MKPSDKPKAEPLALDDLDAMTPAQMQARIQHLRRHDPAGWLDAIARLVRNID